MINSLFLKVRGFLLNPRDTFQQIRDDEPGVPFMYFCTLLLLNVILSALIEVFSGVWNLRLGTGILSGTAAPFTVLIFFMVCSIVLILLLAAWIHMWVYIFGGRKGIKQTFKAILYGDTPYLLFGWIPFIGSVFAFWSLVLCTLGIRELQEVSTPYAILAVALAIITLVIPLILIIAWLMTSNMVFIPLPFSPAH